MFNALVVNKDEDGNTSAGVSQLTLDQLPEGEVVVAVEYSTVNWKDGLCLGSKRIGDTIVFSGQKIQNIC